MYTESSMKRLISDILSKTFENANMSDYVRVIVVVLCDHIRQVETTSFLITVNAHVVIPVKRKINPVYLSQCCPHLLFISVNDETFPTRVLYFCLQGRMQDKRALKICRP